MLLLHLLYLLVMFLLVVIRRIKGIYNRPPLRKSAALKRVDETSPACEIIEEVERVSTMSF